MFFIIILSTNRYPPVVIFYLTNFIKNIKIVIFFHISLLSPAGLSLLCMLIGPPNPPCLIQTWLSLGGGSVAVEV